MSGLAHHQFQFARPHLHGVCAKAARLHPSSLGRAAAIVHDQHQRLTRTERGKLVGMCASTLGVAKTGRRFAGLGCLLPYSAGGYGFRSFSALSHIDGIGVGCSRYPFASKLQHEIAIEKAKLWLRRLLRRKRR